MNNTKLEWVQKHEADFFKITFQEMFTRNNAQQASEEWIKQFKSKEPLKFHVIFDAKNLDDYEPTARSIWQRTISTLKNQILDITVITDSKVIAAGAKIMGVFTSFKINTVDCEEKIFAAMQKGVGA